MPVGPDFRADAAAMADAIDDDTVLVVASAPSYAHGVVDPVTEIAAAAAARGVRCHVDACIGGWVLPYAARLGRAVPPWTFAVEGVTSISVDTHKYAYAPKGTSLLLHRDAALRKPQFFASAAWPGYTMLNATTQSTRSGGPIAGTWAVVEHIGDEGYARAGRPGVRRRRRDRRVHRAGARAAPGGRARLDPRHAGHRRDARPVHADRRAGRARVVRPAAAVVRRPRPEHPPVRQRRHARARRRSSRRRWASRWRPPRRPARWRSTPGVVAFIEALDPATLGDDDFDGLLAASGLVGASAEGDLELPDPDGRGQRDARRGVARRCARRCWWRSSTGCSGRSSGDELARRPRREGARRARLGRGARPGRRPDRRDGSLPAGGGRPPAAATSPPPTGSSGRSSARWPTYACWWWGRTPIPTRSTRSG